jgi:hypothetical protein
MPVNQADREAAKDCLFCVDEPYLVEAFMRHRLAGMELARAEAAKECDKASAYPVARKIRAAILAIDLDALGEKE